MTSNFIHFAGLNLRGFSRDAIYSSEEFPKIIVTVNADIFVSANKNKELAKIIEDNFGTIDGQIPFLFASKLSEKNGNNLEKISGSDFVIELLERAALEDKRIFMLGGNTRVKSNCCREIKGKI
jgi:UDP-N-acetyl-D-mannosaminuronic acid transferase (WecB/TagA/CpsF family)